MVALRMQDWGLCVPSPISSRDDGRTQIRGEQKRAIERKIHSPFLINGGRKIRKEESGD